MPFHLKAIQLLLSAFLLALAARVASASDNLSVDSKYFRSDAGVARSAGSLPENLDAPDTLCWRTPLDPGHSTPILHGGKIFLTTFRADSKQVATVALDEKTGRLLWRNALVPEHIEQT